MHKQQVTFARPATRRALTLYHRCYDNELYRAATNAKTTQYANALIDEALALSGHPLYCLSHRRWCREALAFLKEFAQVPF